MAERLQRIRSGIALKIAQYRAQLKPGLKILEEAFGIRYRADQQICENPTNRLFAGFDTQGPQRVVIKYSKSPKFSGLIKREGELLIRLRHPHIVKCLEQGGTYLVLEHLLSAPLSKLQLSPEEVLVVLFDATEALSYAHQKHLVVRDLKPEHFLFSESGELKMIDFALARDRMSPRDIVSGHEFIGTSEFIAPEVMRDGSASAQPSSDYYSLGVSLYDMLADQIIWNRTMQIFEVGNREVSYPPEGPTFTEQWAKQVPAVFRPILEGLLERVPAKRLCDPDKLQRMILEALFKKEESPR
jgi:serine/threonine protein kinase